MIMIFKPDEMELREVNPKWSRAELLKQKGIFFLKDLVDPLNLSRTVVYNRRDALLASKRDPWRVMGLRKFWSHWQIRMKVFAPYYRRYLIPIYDEIPVDWDANRLVHQKKGVYKLREVCKLIPFTSEQIRYRTKTHKDPRQTMGVWKDKASEQYVVDLAIFSPWLKHLWTKTFDPGEVTQ